MTDNRRCVDILFDVENKLYKARVFLFQPTAIIIPDQNIIAITTLSPYPDSSTAKDRRKNNVQPDDRGNTPKTPRSILDVTGRLNPLSIVQLSPDQPSVFKYHYIAIATRSYTLPR